MFLPTAVMVEVLARPFAAASASERLNRPTSPRSEPMIIVAVRPPPVAGAAGISAPSSAAHIPSSTEDTYRAMDSRAFS